MVVIHMVLPLPQSFLNGGGFTWCLHRSRTVQTSTNWSEITCRQCMRLYRDARESSWHPLYYWAGFEGSPAAKTPADMYQLLKPYAATLQEHFLCITLSTAMRVRNIHVVTIGLLDQTIIHSREVFARAIQDSAQSIIVAHNHPSGTVDPSHTDILLTEQLKSAGELLGIPVTDHIIFTIYGYLSMREEGYL